MAREKIEKCDFWDYLPKELKRIRRKRLSMAEKNVLAVLIFHYYENSDYRREHDGWFYAAKSTTLVEETNMSKNTVRKALVNLQLERMICTTIGKNVQKNAEIEQHLTTFVQQLAKIVHYKFTSQVSGLLTDIDDFDENYMTTREEKIRQDESSKDESSQDKIREVEEKANTSELPF